ncbi:MAG: hypothetical protein PHU14_13275 [Methylovulum sp.]|nr:hypothetical protein [Methylovulum sp.]
MIIESHHAAQYAHAIAPHRIAFVYKEAVMWITQTYLGAVEPDAKLFVYYFFTNYIEEENEFTKMVQQELENMGEVFGGDVSLLMPNPRYAGRIEAEVRENRPLWKSIHDKTPGLFISKEPLSRLNRESDGCFFVSFKGTSREDVLKAAQTIRKLASEQISWDFATLNKNIKSQSFGERFCDAIELKPGIFGIRIDLRTLFRI